MKSEREIEMIIRRTEQEIKRIKPTIKSMGSPEARKVERLEGKIEAFKEVVENENKEYMDTGVSVNGHGTHTIVSEHGDVSSSSVIDPRITTINNKY